jgi:hypothetical protein
MPVSCVLAFILAALAAMAAVAEQMHSHERHRHHDPNPVFRKPFHASTPSMERFIQQRLPPPSQRGAKAVAVNIADPA